MSSDYGSRISADQNGQKSDQRRFLGSCPGVGRGAVGFDAAGICHSDAVGVMAYTMGSDCALRAPGLDSAVKAYQIVVTDLAESSLAMPAVDLCRADAA